MPIHDWSRVDAGIFHGFHVRWLTHLAEKLNAGILPKGHYAELTPNSEGLGDRTISSIIPVQIPEIAVGQSAVLSELAIQSRVTRKVIRPKAKQRRLNLYRLPDHRLIAILEIVSPGNKDRRRHAMEFAGKLANAIESGIHVTVIDLFPPTPAAPNGLHNLIWREFDRDPVPVPTGQPLVLAAFVARSRPRIFFEFRAVGGELPIFPLPIDAEIGAMMPLAETYAAAFAGSPPYLREQLSLTAKA